MPQRQILRRKSGEWGGGKKAGLTQGGKKRGVRESTDFCEPQTALHLHPHLGERWQDPRKGYGGWWGDEESHNFQASKRQKELHRHVHGRIWCISSCLYAPVWPWTAQFVDVTKDVSLYHGSKWFEKWRASSSRTGITYPREGKGGKPPIDCARP